MTQSRDKEALKLIINNHVNIVLGARTHSLNLFVSFCLFLDCFGFEIASFMYPRMVQNYVCSPGWPQTPGFPAFLSCGQALDMHPLWPPKTVQETS